MVYTIRQRKQSGIELITTDRVISGLPSGRSEHRDGVPPGSTGGRRYLRASRRAGSRKENVFLRRRRRDVILPVQERFFLPLAFARRMGGGSNPSLGLVRLKRRRNWTSSIAISLILFVPPAFDREAKPRAHAPVTSPSRSLRREPENSRLGAVSAPVASTSHHHAAPRCSRPRASRTGRTMRCLR